MIAVVAVVVVVVVVVVVEGEEDGLDGDYDVGPCHYAALCTRDWMENAVF